MAKKKYIKPIISFEKLSIGSPVSASCAFDFNFADFACPVLIPEIGETVFQDNNCDWTSDDYYLCYHVPTMDMNVFGS